MILLLVSVSEPSETVTEYQFFPGITRERPPNYEDGTRLFCSGFSDCFHHLLIGILKGALQTERFFLRPDSGDVVALRSAFSRISSLSGAQNRPYVGGFFVAYARAFGTFSLRER